MINPNFIVRRGSVAELNAVPISDGQLLFTTDGGRVYLDVGETRIELYKKDLDTIIAAIDTLSGEGEGSVSAEIAAVKNELEKYMYQAPTATQLITKGNLNSVSGDVTSQTLTELLGDKLNNN